ncbi:MAG: hypothetical protein HY702_03235 [Gemmatimonadetes bacterium]|nr:hypothetical protein [Gemmatimonadota bacterium]
MSWHFRDGAGDIYEAYVFHERPTRQAPGGLNRGPAMLGFIHVRSGAVRAKIPLPADFPPRPSPEYLRELFEQIH